MNFQTFPFGHGAPVQCWAEHSCDFGVFFIPFKILKGQTVNTLRNLSYLIGKRFRSGSDPLRNSPIDSENGLRNRSFLIGNRFRSGSDFRSMAPTTFVSLKASFPYNFQPQCRATIVFVLLDAFLKHLRCSSLRCILPWLFVQAHSAPHSFRNFVWCTSCLQIFRSTGFLPS